MKALMFDYSIPKIVLKKIGLGGKFMLVRYGDAWKVPKIVHPYQVLVRTSLGGICATDLRQMEVAVSLYASIMASPVNPIPMGHEAIGVVEKVGSAVKDLKPGDRVAYNPVTRCDFFGYKPCPSCRNGNYQHCFCLLGVGDGSELEQKYGGRRGFGGFGGGGFSEYLLAFEKQLHRIPAGLPDEVAILAEPFTIALHAVARHMPGKGDTVVVVGAGIIGLLTIKALRALGSKCRIISIARYPVQAEMARRLGATEVIAVRDTDMLYDSVASATGGSLFKPLLSKRVLYGNQGPDIIYDCVASEVSVDDDLRLVRSNGRVVLVGLGFNITKKVDWSLAIWKEVELAGTIFSGMEPYKNKRINSFDLALRLLAADPESFRGLVSHSFPIERYREAFECSQAKQSRSSIKVVMDFRNNTAGASARQ